MILPDFFICFSIQLHHSFIKSKLQALMILKNLKLVVNLAQSNFHESSVLSNFKVLYLMKEASGFVRCFLVFPREVDESL